tara:strand:- start:1394 stop:1903 length:510 start_codon:yes stop_codon:yes gene_type:complete
MMRFILHGLDPKTISPKPEWNKGDFIITTNKSGVNINPYLKKEYNKFLKNLVTWTFKNKGVTYFDKTVWSWKPLWTFVCSNCDDFLTDEDAEGGSHNNGYTVNKTKAKKIAQRLRKLIASGDVSAYKTLYDQYLESLPNAHDDKAYPFEIEDVKEFERFCELSGGFEIC